MPSQSEIKYIDATPEPKRLTMINVTHCDWCNKLLDEETFLITIYDKTFLGWQACKKHYILFYPQFDKWCIAKSALVEEFGDDITIHRSNGDIEKGWAIETNAYRNAYWSQLKIKVCRGILEKWVPLVDLRAWNK